MNEVQPILISLGDISCTQTEVLTPAGRHRLGGTQWTLTPVVQSSQSIPVWAIVVAILFFWVCLLGLLFLLVKEERTSGYVQITVQGDGLLHTTQVPISQQNQVADLNARVNYVRSLVLQA